MTNNLKQQIEELEEIAENINIDYLGDHALFGFSAGEWFEEKQKDIAKKALVIINKLQDEIIKYKWNNEHLVLFKHDNEQTYIRYMDVAVEKLKNLENENKKLKEDLETLNKHSEVINKLKGNHD